MAPFVSILAVNPPLQLGPGELHVGGPPMGTVTPVVHRVQPGEERSHLVALHRIAGTHSGVAGHPGGDGVGPLLHGVTGAGVLSPVGQGVQQQPGRVRP